MTEQAQTQKSARTVTVGCKMPNGLILQLWKFHEETEIGPGGQSRKAQVARPDGDPVRLNGFAAPVGGPQPKHLILGGYGLTPGIDADFMERWMKENALSTLVKNKIVYVAATRDAAESKAEEMASIRSGLEPLDPTHSTAKDGRIVPNDPRFPRSMNPNLSAVHQATS